MWLMFKTLTLSYDGGFEMYKEGSSHSSAMMAKRGGNAVLIHLCFARKGGVLVALRTITLIGMFCNTSIMLVIVVLALGLPQYSTVYFCTNQYALSATSKVRSNLSGISFWLYTRTSHGTCSSSIVVTCSVLSSLSFIFLLGNHWWRVLLLTWNYSRLSPVQQERWPSQTWCWTWYVIVLELLSCKQRQSIFKLYCHWFWRTPLLFWLLWPSAGLRYSLMDGFSSLCFTAVLSWWGLFGWSSVLSLGRGTCLQDQRVS